MREPISLNRKARRRTERALTVYVKIRNNYSEREPTLNRNIGRVADRFPPASSRHPVGQSYSFVKVCSSFHDHRTYVRRSFGITNSFFFFGSLDPWQTRLWEKAAVDKWKSLGPPRRGKKDKVFQVGRDYGRAFLKRRTAVRTSLEGLRPSIRHKMVEESLSA